jgi:prepilin-type N-terminal cleavage/methylation domain-containing protein
MLFSNPHKENRGQSGFTLLELMAALVLVLMLGNVFYQTLYALHKCELRVSRESHAVIVLHNASELIRGLDVLSEEMLRAVLTSELMASDIGAECKAVVVLQGPRAHLEIWRNGGNKLVARLEVPR